MASYEQQVTLLLVKLDAQVSDETADKMLKAITATQHADLADYPPGSSANTPPGNNGYSWYVRGFGTRTRTGKSYATSERFNSRWQERSHGMRRRDLDNNASYGGYLMGNNQVSWAKGVGWRKMKKVLQEEGEKYLGLAARVMQRVNKG